MVIREVTIAARSGGDPAGNPRLRLAVQTAKEANMPNDNIQRAIKKGTGEMEGVTYEEIIYEGYGPGGVAVLVDVMTDNRNRTAGEVRHTFAKNDGNLGTSGGEPRSEIDPSWQRRDYRTAISYAQTLKEVDPERIGKTDRVRELVCIGAAFGVNCVSTLKVHLEAAESVGMDAAAMEQALATGDYAETVQEQVDFVQLLPQLVVVVLWNPLYL